MSKILISSIGKGVKGGEYNPTKYVIGAKKSVYKGSSIAKVLTEHLQIDKLFLLGTSGSAWDMIAENFKGEDELALELMHKVETATVTHHELNSLNEVIDNYLDTKGSKSWIIDYGVNDEELWNNFSTLLEISKSFEEGDEIYLDITHAFRSLPMMSFVMTEFASQVSEIDFKLSGIFYGMFEYSNDPKNSKKGITPIIDLGIIYELHQWIKAIDAMKNYGNLDPLVNLLGDAEDVEKDVEKVFSQLNNNIKLANLASLKQFVTTAHKKIRALENSGNKIVKLLSEDIIRFVERLNKERMSDFQFELSKWFYENQQYALSYMALAEAIVTKNAELSGIDRETIDHTDKELMREIKNIQAPYDKFFQKKYDNSITEIRDNIAHQLNGRKDFVKQDIERLDNYIKQFEEYFKKERKKPNN